MRLRARRFCWIKRSGNGEHLLYQYAISVGAAGLAEVSSKLDGLAYIFAPLLPESP